MWVSQCSQPNEPNATNLVWTAFDVLELYGTTWCRLVQYLNTLGYLNRALCPRMAFGLNPALRRCMEDFTNKPLQAWEWLAVAFHFNLEWERTRC